MVLPYGSLSAMFFLHIFGGGLFYSILTKCIFSPESDIGRLVLKGDTLGR